MNRTTEHTIDIASALGGRGFDLVGIVARTPDGRTWHITPLSAGGGVTNFRLLEAIRDSEDGLEEHDAIDGEGWNTGDLAEYLDAVGRIRP